MKNRLKKTVEYIYSNKPLAAFLATICFLGILYITRLIYPISDRSFMRMDFYHQYAPFAKDFRRRLFSGEGLLFSWNNGLGVNYWAQFCYYLSSPTCWLYLLVPEALVVEAMNFFVVLKGGLAASTMTYYLGCKGAKSKPYRIVFGMAYALGGFYMAYMCNVMWVDMFLVFPLMMLGVERIVKGKSGLLFFLTLVFGTLSNYYIAIIAGFCCIVYYFYLVINLRRFSFKRFILSGLKLLAYTVLSCMVAGIVLLPTYLALKQTNAGFSTFPKEWDSYFPVYELYTQMLANLDPSQSKVKEPNIYSSIMVLTLLPLYFTNSKIRLKKRITSGIIVAFLLASFNLNYFDYFWHGLHFPNSFPCRQSFFFVFLLVGMGYECFLKRKGIPKMAIIISGTAQAVAMITLWIFTGSDYMFSGVHIFAPSIAFTVTYSFFLFGEKLFSRKVYMRCICFIFLAEILMNTLASGMNSYVTRSEYSEQDAMTAELRDYLATQENGEFFRMEELNNKKIINDSFWEGYAGVSYFSSTMRDGLMHFYSNMGMRTSNVSYSLEGATPFTSSVLGVNYIFGTEQEKLGSTFEESIMHFGGKEVYVYENKAAFPFGYIVSGDFDNSFTFSGSKDPFISQNNYANAVLGHQSDLFTALRCDKLDDSPLAGIGDVLSAGSGKVENAKLSDYSNNPVSIRVPAGKHAFAYIRNRVEDANIALKEESNELWIVSKHDGLEYKRILDLGIHEEDTQVLIYSEDSKAPNPDVVSYYINEPVLEEISRKLYEQPFEITEMGNASLTGRVKCTQDGMLLLPLAYDDGWSVHVDGIPRVTTSVKEALLCVPDLEIGEHTIELTYMPPGFIDGLKITICGLVITAVLLFVKGIKRRKKNI